MTCMFVSLHIHNAVVCVLWFSCIFVSMMTFSCELLCMCVIFIWSNRVKLRDTVVFGQHHVCCHLYMFVCTIMFCKFERVWQRTRAFTLSDNHVAGKNYSRLCCTTQNDLANYCSNILAHTRHSSLLSKYMINSE